MLDRNSHISKCISWLQFPLAILVILMHTDVTYDHSDPSSIINAWICWPIPASAMPAFFFISGYLFFAGRDSFGPKDYAAAMRRKFFTLLIPYIIWVVIAYLSAVIIHGAESMPDPTDIRRIFWNGRTVMAEYSLFGYSFQPFGMPTGFGVMWFVRDLMILMLATPLIWTIVRILGKWTVIPVIIAILSHSGVPGLGMVGPCYFTLGAVFSICRIDFMPTVRRFGGFLIASWLVICLLFGWMVYNFDLNHLLNGPLSKMLRDIAALTGVFALFAIASYSLTDSRCDRLNRLLLFLAPTGFIMYVVHPLPTVDLLAHSTDIIVQDPKWQLTVAFFWFIAIRLTLIPVLYFFMLRYFPGVLSVISGNRTTPSSYKKVTQPVPEDTTLS